MAVPDPARALLLVTVEAVAAIGTCPAVMPERPDPLPALAITNASVASLVVLSPVVCVVAVVPLASAVLTLQLPDATCAMPVDAEVSMPVPPCAGEPMVPCCCTFHCGRVVAVHVVARNIGRPGNDLPCGVYAHPARRRWNLHLVCPASIHIQSEARP